MIPHLRLFAPDGPPSPPSDTPTVRDVIDWFTDHHPPGRSASVNKERQRLFGLFLERYGAVPVDRMRGADLVEFAQSSGKPDKAANTVDRWYRTLKQPFTEAERLGLIAKSPFRAVRSPRGAKGRDLSPQEFRSALRFATPPFRRVLVFLRYSGCRPGELAKLRWSDIGDEICRLNEHKTSHKSGAPRRIWLNSITGKLLAWLRRRSVSDYVFVNSYGGPWKSRALSKNLERIRVKSGLPPDAKLYGCRHAFATNAITAGLDVATVMVLMGHTDIRTTQRYLHLADKNEQMKLAAERAVRK